jgi:hypothetical protein
MEDWASTDFSLNGGGVFYAPPDDSDRGVAILDAATRDEDFPGWDTGAFAARQPLRRYDPRPPLEGEDGPPRGTREGMVTGVLRSRPRGSQAVRKVAWDERPQRYGPYDGPARLFPRIPSLASSSPLSRAAALEKNLWPAEKFLGGGCGCQAGAIAGEIMSLRPLLLLLVVMLVIVIVGQKNLQDSLASHRSVEAALRPRGLAGTG